MGVYCCEGAVSIAMKVWREGVYSLESWVGGVSAVMSVGREQCLLS